MAFIKSQKIYISNTDVSKHFLFPLTARYV